MQTSLSTVIPSGDHLSGAIDTLGLTLIAIKIPAAMTGANFTFKACESLAGDYETIYYGNGNPITVNIVADTFLVLDPKDFQGFRYLKIRSDAAEAADRTLICSLKGI
jgi:hypothetical protein